MIYLSLNKGMDLNRLRDSQRLVRCQPFADSIAIPLPPKGDSLTREF